MSTSGWLDSNSRRAYPFRQDEELPVPAPTWPPEILLDAGFTLGSASAHDPARHALWLYRAEHRENSYCFVFRGDAPGLVGWQWVFEVAKSLAEYAITRTFLERDTAFSSLEAGSSSESSLATGLQEVPHCRDSFQGEGFLITGELGPESPLATFLPAGATWEDSEGRLELESCLVLVEDRPRIQRVLIANQERTRHTAPAGCSSPDLELGPGPFLVHACLQGTLILQAGANTSLRQTVLDNSLTLSPSRGAGTGLACTELERFSGEAAQVGAGALLTGGPSCEETIARVNGLPGPHLRLRGGGGIRVTAGAGPHEILIDADLGGLAYCTPAETASSSSSPGTAEP